MPNLSAFSGEPLLDIASYARKGPARRDRLTPDQVAQVARTVNRVPEVVVKVLPRHANTVGGVQKHLGYIGRYGELSLETDDGDHYQGPDVGRDLAQDWDLDLDEHRRKADLTAVSGGKPPKLVHKLILSMPAGTPPQDVLKAARVFLREEFALSHRYAFVLHTDEPHPHVHAVVKAVSEHGTRLHIKKATLREWRQRFARHLREQGIAANATERAVRGEGRTGKIDPIYRATRRGNSTHARGRIKAIANALRSGELSIEPGKAKLLRTRTEVAMGWHAVSDILVASGQPELAAEVRRFVDQMSPPQTDNERLSTEFLARTRQRSLSQKPAAR